MAITINRGSVPQAQDTLPGPVGFIGAGKVGIALAALLHAHGVRVSAVSGRTMEGSLHMAHSAGLSARVASDRATTLANANLVFLTVPDDAIGPLCKEIADEGGWRAGQGVVHCSGALPSSILQPAKDAGALIASFHPLQTFASREAALAHMPGSTFALEGDPTLVAQLEQLVHLLGGTALRLRAEEKTLYHAAATIASNYMVTLAALASDLLVREGVAPDLNTALRHLIPLMRGTIDNLDTLGLPDALTGALARGDVGTVTRHLQALDACAPETAQLYRHLARLTLPLARETGGLDEKAMKELRKVLSENGR